MSFLELIRVALTSFVANKVRSLLTTLGVVIGVLAVILLVALGDGARMYLDNMFAGMGSNLIFVRAGKRETKGMGPPMNTTYKITLEDVRALEHRAVTLDGVCPATSGAATLSYANRRRDMMLFGVGKDFDRIRQMRVDVGRYFDADDIEARRRYIVIGRTAASELFGEENPLGKLVKVSDGEFRVVGLMEKKGTSLGMDLDDLAFIPVTTALDMYGQEGVTEILIKARDRAGTAAAIAEVTEILKARHNGQEDFTVVSQEDMLSTVNQIMATMSLVLLAIASISLVVGGIGIANIMLVSVRERTREIGVRRAVGARRRDIMTQFLVESVVISLLGGLIGLLLGGTIIWLAKVAVPDLPVKLSAWIVSVAVGFSAIVGVVSGIWPAMRAADLDPVEALRYE
jgi:putative ABC transport system permease protein